MFETRIDKIPRILTSDCETLRSKLTVQFSVSTSEKQIDNLEKMTNKGGPETEEQAKVRFQVELEFVQCLGNPHYLNFLAQRGYFKDQSFINYLKYLLYWKEADYAKYIKYPMCLYFLDLLQYEHFRREIVNAQCAKFIDDQILLLWQHYTRRRTKFLQTAMESHALNSNCSMPVNGNMNGTAPSSAKNNGPPCLMH